MSARMRQTERAIFLVDAFPLDSLVAALALGVREAVLVFCPAQRSVAEALERRLAKRGIVPVLCELAPDPAADDATKLLDQIEPGWFLDHTGGMPGAAVALTRAAVERGVPAAQTLRLDEERRCVRFDDGLVAPIAAALDGRRVGIEDVLALAGLRHAGGGRPEVEPQLVREVGRWALADGGDNRRQVARLAPKRSFTRAWAAEHLPAAVADGLHGRTVKQWFDFLSGKWLEDLAALALGTAAEARGVDVVAQSGVALRRVDDGAALEVDVLAVVGHRPHLISCTTQTDQAAVRAKAFEAERRAWQLGGPVVRPAVAAPVLDHSAATVEANFRDPFGAYRSTELVVFGQDELTRWTTAPTPDPSRIDAWVAAGLGLP